MKVDMPRYLLEIWLFTILRKVTFSYRALFGISGQAVPTYVHHYITLHLPIYKVEEFGDISLLQKVTVLTDR